MMKPHFAFAAAALVGSATVAAPAPDWSAVVAPAAKGSYVIGNPAAKVKLVEYVSYTCPHCAHFTAESAAVLKGRMVRSGSTSIEIRNLAGDKFDVAATMLGRCVGATAFVRYHEAVFAKQQDWLAEAVAFDRNNAARIQLYPQADQLKALAAGAGLTDIARAAGMTDAAVDACFGDKTVLARTLTVRNWVNPGVRGTPAFEINGKLVQNVTWAKLEPMLRAAGAK